MFQKALFNAVGQIHQHTHNEQKSFHLTGEGTLLSDKMYSSWCALGLSMKWIYPRDSLVHPRLEQPAPKTKRDSNVLLQEQFQSTLRSSYHVKEKYRTTNLSTKEQKTKTKKASPVGFVCCSTSLMESN